MRVLVEGFTVKSLLRDQDAEKQCLRAHHETWVPDHLGNHERLAG